MFACLHGPGDLTAIAFDFSPLVEQTAPDTVTFDVSGLDRLFGLPQEIAAAITRRAPNCRLALAANPDAAICAARGFPGVNIIPQGDEAKFLGSLPVALLGPSEELQETLERWGVRKLHQLAALPPLGIAERLGPEGLRLRELARGEADRKLKLIEDPLKFEDEIELDYPVELLEPLMFVLARLIGSLATRLGARALATDELRLKLGLENRATHERTLRLPTPSLDTKAFLKLWQLDLAAHAPSAAVVKVWMGVNPVKPRAAQSGLFIPAAPEPVRLELTLAWIKAIVGEDRVGVAELVDSHRPGAFVLRAWGVGTGGQRLVAGGRGQLALRPFRPARAARVALDSGQPDFVTADGVRGKVIERAGPWRTTGDWWTKDPWSRDEWDIALSDGAVYRLYCDPRGWFVEGSYD